MPKPVVRIGTRASRLALAQSGQIQKRLSRLHPDVQFRLVRIRTAGDEFKSVEYFKQTGIGIFTKAIEKKLLAREIDLAVHSLKDLPTDQPKGLVLAAIPKRLNTSDVLISKKRHSLRSLPSGSRIGTGSERRAAQLRLARPDLQIVPIRGNLDTRIAKALTTGELSAIVLARAGLKRLGGYEAYTRSIPDTVLMPAVGQGALGIQARREDRLARSLTERLHDSKTGALVEVEREFLKTLRGGCRVPVGVTSRHIRNQIEFAGAVFSTRTNRVVRGSFRAPLQQSRAAARRLALQLLKQGAGILLAEARA